MDVHVQDQARDDKLAEGATHFTDLDLIVSPRDGRLVAVAENFGVHVCWNCGEQFVENNPSHKHRGVEVNPGGYGTRILLHACCVTPRTRMFGFIQDKVRGYQQRKRLAEAAKHSGIIAG